MFFNSYKRENEVLRAELANARAEKSDLTALLVRLQEGWAVREAALIDKIIALSSPTTHSLLKNPTTPRASLPREPQSTRWPGWRPDTDPAFNTSVADAS